MSYENMNKDQLIQEIQQLKSQIKELSDEKEIFESDFKIFYNQLPTPVLIVGENKIIKDVNQAFCQLVSLSDKNILGSHCNHLFKNCAENCPLNRDQVALKQQSFKIEKEVFLNDSQQSKIPKTIHCFRLDKKHRMVMVLPQEAESWIISASSHLNRDKFQSIFYNMQDGFALCQIIEDQEKGKRDFYVKEVNPAFENITSLKREEILNKPFSKISNFFNEHWINQFYQIAHHQQRYHFIMYEPRRKKWYEVLIYSPQKGEFAVLCHDFTNQKQAIDALSIYTKKLQHAIDNAKEANRLKNEFLHSVSHELRTPLNGILGFIQLIEMEDLQGACREYIQYIKTSGERLKKIISDILDISKLERGLITIRYQEVEFSQIIRYIEDHYKERAHEKGLRFLIKIHEGTPNRIHIDKKKYLQLLSNLLDNAIKFTDVGEIQIHFYFKEDRIYCMVKDTGIGISYENRAMIFEPFIQLDYSTSRLVDGTGLGLSICRKIVDQLGGDILLESEPQKGSCFTFYIPILKHEKSIYQPYSDHIKESISNKTVLIVENDEVTPLIIEKVLERSFINVFSAQGIKEFTALVEKLDQLSVIFINFSSITKGIQLYSSIFHTILKDSSYIIIGILDINYTDKEREMVHKYCHDYILKPINMDRLQQIIEKWIR